MSDMSFFAKFSSQLYLNEKVQEFAEHNSGALFAWVLAITYCVDQHTDGVFSAFAARRYFNASNEDLQALAEAGFIEIIGEDKYQIHDYDQAQMTTDRVKQLREKRAAAGRKGMARRWGQQARGDDNSDENEITSVITNDNKPITSVITNRYQTITDIDIDKDIDNIYTYKQDNQLSNSEHAATQATTSQELTATHTSLIAQAEQITKTIIEQVRIFYPPARFDADSTHCQFALENALPRISQAAGETDIATWFVRRTKAYVTNTQQRYIKKFSRYIEQQTYLQAWEQVTPQSAQPANRSQAGLRANLDLIKHYEALEAEEQYAQTQ